VIEAEPSELVYEMANATWVEPVVEAEIDYRSKTDAGLVRHGSFKGLRDDLATVDIPRPPGRRWYANRRTSLSGNGRG